MGFDEHSFRNTLCHGRRLTSLIVACCVLSTISIAQQFQTAVISQPETYNSDAVISDTGLVGWMFYSTNLADNMHSHIGVFKDGTFRDLTGEITDIMYAAGKPVVSGDRMVFLASARKFDRSAQSWVLREVQDRDEGEFPELTANYQVGDSENTFYIPQENATNTTEQTEENRQLEARRHPSGEAEVWFWQAGEADVARVTHDERNDFAAFLQGNTIAWQKAKGWPFGWEIMAYVDGVRMQLTTNYFYDMGPKVHGKNIVWYGWDGFDYEIYLCDTEAGTITQITSNRYDDVAPVIYDGVIAWEGYPAVESDIYLWKDGEIKKISSNIDDDLLPRIWGNQVVWQGFDGDDFEIYLYEIDKGEVTQITGNRYDDTNPEIADNLLVWMGYEGNWDAEVYALDTSNLRVGSIKPEQLTDNEEDDRDPKTAGGRIVWISEEQGETRVMLAEPR